MCFLRYLDIIFSIFLNSSLFTLEGSYIICHSDKFKRKQAAQGNLIQVTIIV